MITILNASPRNGGINDLICADLQAGFRKKGLESTMVVLRKLDIRGCNNCRACMKNEGDEIGRCHIADDMAQVIEPLLMSRTIIVTAPINCYDLPSGFKVMLERFAVFCYWSDEMYAPKVRPNRKRKNGFLITTSALPSIMVPILTCARKTFRLFTKPVGITKPQYCHLGFKGRKMDRNYNENDRKAVKSIIEKAAVLHAASPPHP